MSEKIAVAGAARAAIRTLRGQGYTYRGGQLWKPPIGNKPDFDPLDAAQATIAQQAQMIEHLRGGPTPLYTAVDMANAARDERKGIADSLIERLAMAFPDSDAMMTVECVADWLSKEMKV